jgi:hypothetical protein
MVPSNATNSEPIPMRTSTLLPAQALAIATLINANVLAMAPPPTSSKSDAKVALTGWLHVDDLEMDDVTLEVEVNGVVRTAAVTNAGRFDIDLPAESAVILRFEKPGHVTKEVTVDTRHVQDGAFTEAKKRHVKFAVIMEQVRFMAGLTYAGPVGDIGFEDGGGCIAVAHTRSVEPAKRRAAMEF